MEFDKLLNGKILDPIHGTIRVTDIEKKVIDHKLFQRLRSIKQNSFLYMVFPSAMHSRFEHSLGVMHIAYLMYKNLVLNSYRYQTKYDDNLLFQALDEIPNQYIQELRLAALLHDVGHGPMSHQFDAFLLEKAQLQNMLNEEFKDISDFIAKQDHVEHEHISLIFIKKIIMDTGIGKEINADNVLALIESGYKNSQINIEIGQRQYNIQPLFTSLISSSPIDSDRMDYLLRDSYFSGVKCGIYNIERLLMSVVPVLNNNRVCLAYKESSLDSIAEFVFSRMNLFSQVYFHKTNRSLSAMLSKACLTLKNNSNQTLSQKLYNISNNETFTLNSLIAFYLKNSDDYFINHTIPELVGGDKHSEQLVAQIITRKPWSKIYEYKKYQPATIKQTVDRNLIKNLKNHLGNLLSKTLSKDDYIIDIASDNAFKDLQKTQIYLLVKSYNNQYTVKHISDCSDKLDIFQSLRYIVRVFINPAVQPYDVSALQKEMDIILQNDLP